MNGSLKIAGAGEAWAGEEGALTDEALASTLPGFSSRVAHVNGTSLHYVVGGAGPLLVLLPGWPQTWWSFHKIMPALARRFTVVAVDLRGMGSSEKAFGGYDKKNMARDVYELVRHLGHAKAHVVGHDIGAQVGWSYAANYPEATAKLVMVDVVHPHEGFYQMTLLPRLGGIGEKMWRGHPHLWWFAFNQLDGLPEKLLAGRAGVLQDWLFDYMLQKQSSVSSKDRAIYANAYDTPEAIRAGNAWYQAFPQDIIDEKTYAPIQVPVLGIAGPGFRNVSGFIDARARMGRTVQIPDCGHFVPEEAPDEMVRLTVDFFESGAAD